MSDKASKITVLTPEVQAAILKLVKAGNYLVTACNAAGISYDTFRHWQKRWEEGDSVAEVFSDFFKAIKRGSAEAESNAIEDLKKGDPGWQAKAWFLERRFHQRWGKKEKAEPVTIDFSKMTEEQLRAIRDGKVKGGGGT